MGLYLNPGSELFAEALRSEIYVDKTGLIACTNKVLGTMQKYICVSRPRRFGKSLAAQMLAAYYGYGIDCEELFQGLEIAQHPSFEEHKNRYHALFLNIQDFLSRAGSAKDTVSCLQEMVVKELRKLFPDLISESETYLPIALEEVYRETNRGFVIIIDEWDCIFRVSKGDKESQTIYLDFLRALLKDRAYVRLAYMTGILPVKKYGTHSALNMFDEYSMMNPGMLARYVGFTEEEVKRLCQKYDMDFLESKRWYDGYQFRKIAHVYSPKSVVDAMMREEFDSYWSQTETYEALKIYINMNFDGLKDAIIGMLGGIRCKVNPRTFQNDMTTFQGKDDVLTLLVHLGYLGYDMERKEVFIPNQEVEYEFASAIQGAGWEEVIKAIESSEELLDATLGKDGEMVASGLDEFHREAASVLAYNNENSLSCAVSLAYFSARTYYMVVREMPAGKGFADLVFLPRQNHLDKPALVVELKWDKSAQGAISQIRNREYVKSLNSYAGRLLLVGINYDKESKKHQCVIEEREQFPNDKG